MNPYVKAALVLIGTALASFGASAANGVHDWFIISGGMATALGGAIAGLFVQLPQKEWTTEERAEKLGRQ